MNMKKAKNLIYDKIKFLNNEIKEDKDRIAFSKIDNKADLEKDITRNKRLVNKWFQVIDVLEHLKQNTISINRLNRIVKSEVSL